MASYFTQFSCVLPVGSTDNLQAALSIYQALAAEKAVAGEEIGFTAKAEPPSDDPEDRKVWLYSDEAGEPEDVIAYAFQCGKALGLTGIWGFRWSLSCSRPLLDGHGGGAHVLDLGTGHAAGIGRARGRHRTRSRQLPGAAELPGHPAQRDALGRSARGQRRSQVQVNDPDAIALYGFKLTGDFDAGWKHNPGHACRP